MADDTITLQTCELQISIIHIDEFAILQLRERGGYGIRIEQFEEQVANLNDSVIGFIEFACSFLHTFLKSLLGIFKLFFTFLERGDVDECNDHALDPILSRTEGAET